ncbi:anti-sigma factor [Ornithinimicrobium flavum]|uniref:anti-sigma factor n=1 Tax=Ornithinimicrobium flavum TaxID=1288636 RepID=UPI0010702520|nr:anti-sigma factor [Ornithinimicrobium flavum]
MNERDLHDLAAAYAVDAVDDEEREAFAAHLPSCESCRQEVAQLTDAAATLSEGLEVPPPPELRDRVLGAVAAEAAGPRRASGDPDPDGAPRGDVVPLTRDRRHRRAEGGHRRGWWAAAAAAVVVGVGGWGVSQTLTPDPLDQVVSADDAQEYESEETPGLAVVTSKAADRAVLRLPEDLELPPSGSVLQAWFIDNEGQARSAGVLDAEAAQERSVLLDGSPSGAAVVGLTVEPDGGSAQPTTDPVGVVPLG